MEVVSRWSLASNTSRSLDCPLSWIISTWRALTFNAVPSSLSDMNGAYCWHEKCSFQYVPIQLDCRRPISSHFTAQRGKWFSLTGFCSDCLLISPSRYCLLNRRMIYDFTIEMKHVHVPAIEDRCVHFQLVRGVDSMYFRIRRLNYS